MIALILSAVLLCGDPNWLSVPPRDADQPGFLIPLPEIGGDSIEIHPNPLGGTTIINPDETRTDCFPTPLGGWKCIMD
jgi:hypothetical protein